MKDQSETVREAIQKRECSCIIFSQDGRTIKESGRGIGPLLQIWKQGEKDCIAGDKIIGKAAAMILVSMQAQYVYGDVMSKSAAKLFRRYKIPYEYGVLTEEIRNRKDTGLCPMEEAVWSIEEPEEAIVAIQKKLEELQNHAE